MARPDRSWDPDAPAPDNEPVADGFLRLACPGEAPPTSAAAADLLAAHPEITADSIFAAAAAADARAVQRHLTHPTAAAVTGGPYHWSPLLYLAFARLDRSPTTLVPTAELLLRHGADANDGRLWRGLLPPFTALTGALGSGDPAETPQGSPALARVLLEHGADPNDGQGLYNRMFGSADDHLELLFEFGLGSTGARSPAWPGQETPTVMLRHLLWWAVCHGQHARIQLLAQHGVDLATPFTELRYRRANGRTPTAEALVAGRPDTADLLAALGAPAPALDPVDSFVAAALAGDTVTVALTPAEVVGRARRVRPGLLVWAAELGSVAAVRILLECGFPVDALGRSDAPIEQPWQSALHVAAGNGALDLARELLTAGASPDLLDARFHSTPLGWAEHFGQTDLVRFLEPLTGRADTKKPG